MALAAFVSAAVTAALARRSHRRQAARDRAVARRHRDEEQAALMGTIASGLAHEIRNPLSTLSMNLQMLQEDWADPITEREQRGSRRIEVLLKEVRRLEDTLNHFLKFAAGHRLRIERVVLNALADELLDFITPQANRANIRVHRAFHSAVPPVQADPNLLRQALLNLLLNAIQAMPQGGDLEVRTEPAPDGPRVHIRDTGVGIPPEHLEKIFNLYFSTTPSGTGLGLPMARKIIEEHGGTLTVTSAAGRGSTFTIHLPMLDARSVPHDDRNP